MTGADKDLRAQRQLIELLYGRCILRLQSYELLMKALVAEHRFSAPIGDLEKAMADRHAGTGQKTLGTLVNEMTGSFLVPKGGEGGDEEADEWGEGPAVAIRFQSVMPEEDFARIEAELRDLVRLRNGLVHGFLAEHDLTTTEGCLAAQEELTTALDRVAGAYEALRTLAREMDQTKNAFRQHLASAPLT
jgi:hypothetical protein